MTSLDELERLAQEASKPCPRHHVRGLHFASTRTAVDCMQLAVAEAEFAAALDPTTVLDLIAKARLGEAAREALEVISDGRHPDAHRGAVLVARAALDALTAELEKG